jgi:3-oxoadipate enol-lactonase
MQLRRVALGDIELEISEAGVGGRPLLLLHGFTGAKEDFGEFIDPLSDLGWHVVAPDHRGHGKSSKPDAESAYSIAILAEDALALADELGWDHFALLGHSMGGFIAQEMAFSAPARLDALVLMDTRYGAVVSVDPDLVEAAISVVRSGGIEALADILAGRESPLDTPAHKRLLKERPGYAEFEDYKFRTASPALYISLAAEMVRLPNNLERLRALPASLPTLIIVGEQDTPFLGASREMAAAIPNARLSVIPDAGHSPQFENPERWWQELSRFLAGLAPRSASGSGPSAGSGSGGPGR